ncbi:MAG: hypothetical protein Q8862_12290, partial [Bacteroidota bacterium]|nr:hypothetical protein [Bacteroidota bacterium]
MKKLFSLCFILALCMSGVHGQYFSSGQDPAEIKWNQIKTSHFRIIYPKGYEKQANRVASMLSKVYNYAAVSLKTSPKPIDVILHNHTIQANGFVALAPRRLEMYTVPDQETYGQDWLEQLSIHEFRHVVQMDKLDSEIPLLLKLILGEQSTALITGAYVPFWFLEGDAVCTETALGNTGRGRLPFFQQGLKAQVVEKGSYSYYKAVLGSMRDYVPNHYELGYWITGEARQLYGRAVWDKTLSYIGRNPIDPWAFDDGLKRATGKNKVKLYNQIFTELRAKWKTDADNRCGVSGIVVSPQSKHYQSFRFAQFLNNNEIVAEKSSLDDIDHFVLIDKEGKEKKLFTPGERTLEPLSLVNNILIWSERRPGVRWGNSDRSVICMLNVLSGSFKTLKIKNSKPASPSLSPDGRLIVFAETDLHGDHFISVYNIQKEKVIRKISSPENLFFMTPSWDSDQKNIFAIAVGEKGKALIRIGVQSGQLDILVPFGATEIGQPQALGKYIFFSGAYSGTDNVYALDRQTLKIYQVTDSKFGTRDIAISPDKNHLLVSDYSSKGYALKVIPVDNTNWKDIDIRNYSHFELADQLAAQERGVIDFKQGTDSLCQAKRYSKVGHLLNFHSWAPVFIDISNQQAFSGVSVMSQNVLSTLDLVAGYKFDPTEKYGKYKLNFTYKGFFPILDFEYTGGKNASWYYQLSNPKYDTYAGKMIYQDTTKIRFSWWENNFKVGASLPFNLSGFGYQRFISPSVRWEYTQFAHNASTFSKFYHNSQYLDLNLYAYNLRNTTEQDITPKWGEIISLTYKNTIFSDVHYGTLKAAQGILYLPGFFKNHRINIYGGVQQKDVDTNYFSDQIRIARGYQSFINTQLATLNADYKFPICYPDLNLGKLLYMKRLKAGLYYDLTQFNSFYNSNNKRIPFTGNISSYGAEISL